MTDMAIKTETRIPMSRIQKLIGQRMLESKQTKPCYYIGIKADTTELMDSRHELEKAARRQNHLECLLYQGPWPCG